MTYNGKHLCPTCGAPVIATSGPNAEEFHYRYDDSDESMETWARGPSVGNEESTVEHLSTCRPEHMVEAVDGEGRDCMNCGLFEFSDGSQVARKGSTDA